MAHGLKALLVLLGLDKGDGQRRVEDSGTSLNLLQVADELALQHVLDATVGELPAEVVERRLHGVALDDDALLAVLGLGRLRLDHDGLRHALPERVGDVRERAHGLHGQLLLVLAKGEARLVVLLDDALDHAVEHGVEVDVQLRVLDVADVAAEPVARRVGVGLQCLLDNCLGKRDGHLD